MSKKAEIVIELVKSLNIGHMYRSPDVVMLAIKQYEELVERGVLKRDV